MRRDIQTRRRHFFNQRISLVNYIMPGEARTEDTLVDESASAMVRQLGDAPTDIEVNGHVFGNCSLTLVLHGEDFRAVEHQAAQAAKALSLHDGAFIDETYNLLNAWLSIVPGNGARNLRRLPILETHAAEGIDNIKRQGKVYNARYATGCPLRRLLSPSDGSAFRRAEPLYEARRQAALGVTAFAIDAPAGQRPHLSARCARGFL